MLVFLVMKLSLLHLTVISDHDYPHLDQFVWVDADTVPLKTVNRQCSSGLQAVADVAAAIKAGLYDTGKISCCLILSNFIFDLLVN